MVADRRLRLSGQAGPVLKVRSPRQACRRARRCGRNSSHRGRNSDRQCCCGSRASAEAHRAGDARRGRADRSEDGSRPADRGRGSRCARVFQSGRFRERGCEVDPEREVSRRKAHIALTSLLTVILLAACGQSTPVTAPPEPVPAPVAAAPPPPPTLDEARALKNDDPEKYDRALRGLAMSADPNSVRVARTLLALDLFDRKQFELAVPALQDAAASDPLIAPYLQLRIIQAAETLQHIPDAIGAASSIITTAPESSAATIARLQLPALYAMAGDDTNMTAALQQVESLPIDALTESDFVSLATKLARAGKSDAASALRMRILTDYPEGRYTEQVYSQLTATTPSPIDALSTDDATKLASSLARVEPIRPGARSSASNRPAPGRIEQRALSNRAAARALQLAQLHAAPQRIASRATRLFAATSSRTRRVARRQAAGVPGRPHSNREEVSEEQGSASTRKSCARSTTSPTKSTTRSRPTTFARRSKPARSATTARTSGRRASPTFSPISTTTRCASSTATSANIRTATSRPTPSSGPARSRTASATPPSATPRCAR